MGIPEIDIGARLEPVVKWVSQQMLSADAGHGIDHVRRVVINATRLAREEGANCDVVIPAAWLHDCVVVPKNSPQRSSASRFAADAASTFLGSIGWDRNQIDAIAHCIVAHSFSARIACETLEAKVVQDADRLEAVGAIGIARCLMTGGAMRQRLYHPEDPIPFPRKPEDTEQSVDHFFAKLLGLYETMQTESGKRLAWQRTQFMCSFLNQLGSELSWDLHRLSQTMREVMGRGPDPVKS